MKNRTVEMMLWVSFLHLARLLSAVEKLIYGTQYSDVVQISETAGVVTFAIKLVVKFHVL